MTRRIISLVGVFGCSLILMLALMTIIGPVSANSDKVDMLYSFNTNITSGTGAQWITTTVDVEAGWSPSIVLDQYQIPHIAYTGAGLRYAVLSGSQWITETINDGNGEVSLVFDSSNHPHVSYGNGKLGYAYHNGTTWISQTIGAAGAGSSIGRNSAIQLDSNGHPHIMYYGLNDGINPTGFYHAYFDGSTWITETVSSYGDGNGANASRGLVIDKNNHLHTVFTGFDWSIWYAHHDGTSWSTQRIASAGDGGAIAIAPDDSLHVSYIANDVMYATLNGPEWITQTVAKMITQSNSSQLAPMGWAMLPTALQIDDAGQPHIIFDNYSASYKSLRYASWDGTTWRVENIDSQDHPGWTLSLAVDPSGYPHVAYYAPGENWGLDDMRYAYVKRISANISEHTLQTVVFTGTDLLQTTLFIPDGAVMEPIQLVFTERDNPLVSPSSFEFAGQGFQLEAYRSSGEHISGFTFEKPVTVTLEYSEEGIPNLDENSLELYYWNVDAWEDAACGDYDHSPAENRLSVPICHLSQFALFGQATQSPTTINKYVSLEGQVQYGDELTYTLVISGAPGAEVSIYDPLTSTMFIRFVEQPNGIEYASHTITGTMTITPTNSMTVSFVTQVGVPGTIGIYVDVSNTACIYPTGQTISMCEWSNTVTNQAYRPHTIFLPLVIRGQ